MVFVRLPLTPFVPAVLPPFFGCVSGATEFERESYDSHSPGNVDRAFRGSAGTIVVIDVESRKILAEKSLGFPGKQLMRPGSTREPFVLMEFPDSGRLNPQQRFICPRPLRIAACGSIEAPPRTCRSSTRTTPSSLTLPRAAEVMPRWSRTPSSRNMGK